MDNYQMRLRRNYNAKLFGRSKIAGGNIAAYETIVTGQKKTPLETILAALQRHLAHLVKKLIYHLTFSTFSTLAFLSPALIAFPAIAPTLLPALFAYFVSFL